MAPRGAPGPPKEPKRAPRGLQKSPKEGPKRHPKGPQEAPERSLRAQDDLQDGSDNPNWFKMASNMFQTAHKPLQERPKRKPKNGLPAPEGEIELGTPPSCNRWPPK
eukprot:4407671-Pyramimonas_sp.AAC.1